MEDQAKPSGWEVVTTVPTATEGELVSGFLEAQGIKVSTESRIFTQEPVSLGTLGNVQILVRSEQLAEAKRLLSELTEADEAGADPATAEPGPAGPDS